MLYITIPIDLLYFSKTDPHMAICKGCCFNVNFGFSSEVLEFSSKHRVIYGNLGKNIDMGLLDNLGKNWHNAPVTNNFRSILKTR